MTLLAPHILNDVSYETRINRVAGAVFGEVGGIYPVAPRIVNDVSYVTRINHEIHFAWQAQYLVSLKGDFTCSAHWK